jgi:hypothetical protein
MGTVSKRRCVAGNGRWAERELQDGEQKLGLGLALDVLNRELGLGRRCSKVAAARVAGGRPLHSSQDKSRPSFKVRHQSAGQAGATAK